MTSEETLQAFSFSEQIQRHDADRYLLGLFAPQHLRDDFFVLFALNYELAKVRDTVSEPQLGEMRLLWWQETIANIYAGTVYHHHLVEALSQVIKKHQLPLDLFLPLIGARREELYFQTISTLSDLEAHADKTAGQLLRLQLACMTTDKTDSDAFAQQSGMAWGLTGYIRSFSYYHFMENRLYIPQDLLSLDHHEQYRSGRADDHLRHAVEEMVCRADKHLSKAQDCRSNLPKSLRHITLINELTKSYLKTIRKAQFDPFHLNEDRDAVFRYCRLFLRRMLF